MERAKAEQERRAKERADGKSSYDIDDEETRRRGMEVRVWELRVRVRVRL